MYITTFVHFIVGVALVVLGAAEFFYVSSLLKGSLVILAGLAFFALVYIGEWYG